MNNPRHGWILVDKPTGITSTDVVRQLKKTLGMKKIGHAGTLDPLATGMLPIAIGEGTKTIPYILESDKDYIVTAKWGQATDTDDRDGEVIEETDKLPSQSDIENILSQFTGEIDQTPPIYSAIHVDGRRAYDLARKGEEVVLKSRKVTTFDVKILSHDHDKTDIYVHCSKGTYIRSIIRDMGQVLGCLGHVFELRRLNVGPFKEKMMFSLGDIKEMVYNAGPTTFLHPVHVALNGISVLDLTDADKERLRLGQRLSPIGVAHGLYRIMDDDTLLGLALVDDKAIRPKKMFNIKDTAFDKGD